MPDGPLITVVVLTQDEEINIAGCLDSLRAFDDVHVVDSGSTDGTLAIAEKYGVRIHSRAFDSFAGQRNWALDHCGVKYDWVLFLDADEQATPEFAGVVERAIKGDPSDIAGFFCCWKFIVDGQWLKRCDSFPKWQLRLVRLGRARFVDRGHGQKEGEILGRLDYIREPYLHFPLRKGWALWKQKHERYAAQEARWRLSTPLRFSELFSGHGSRRNTALRLLVSRLPFWPQFRFFHAYVFKGGLLEGEPALAYCRGIAYYEKRIRIEMKKLREG